MAAIWHSDGAGWKLLSPVGFTAEAALHTLVEQAPQLLPLAGSPQLVVLGREVKLGSGYADLIAIEPNGRLVVIEVKLANNAEARRAVVAQILAYAAYLAGLSPVEVGEEVLATHLHARGYASLVDAVRDNDQTGSFDAVAFSTGLAETLAAGSFRLVLVLDKAPDELVRLVGYLESVTDKLVIDLVALSAYDVGGSQILVPQRVDPGRRPARESAPPVPATQTPPPVEGAADFLASIDQAKVSEQPLLHRLADWALSLEHEGLVKLSTYHGKTNRFTLLPRFPDEGVGLVTIYNDNGSGYLQVWGSVFQRRAPKSLAAINQAIAPTVVGQGNTIRGITDEVLNLLTAAHWEARSTEVGATESAETLLGEPQAPTAAPQQL